MPPWEFLKLRFYTKACIVVQVTTSVQGVSLTFNGLGWRQKYMVQYLETVTLSVGSNTTIVMDGVLACLEEHPGPILKHNNTTTKSKFLIF